MNEKCIKTYRLKAHAGKAKVRVKEQLYSSHRNSISQFESTVWMHCWGDRSMRMSRWEKKILHK